MPLKIKIIIPVIASVLIIMIVSIIGLVIIFGYFNNPPLVSNTGRSAPDSIYFEIKPGETISQIGRRLEDLDLIKSSFLWRILNRFDKEIIKAGFYNITLPIRMTELRELFVSGNEVLFRITIPEGFTVKKIANLLDAKGICSGTEFLKLAASNDLLKEYGLEQVSIEGFLYPDTYYFPKNYPVLKIINTMISNFFNRLAESKLFSDQLSDKSSFVKTIILASIIEREYRFADEAPLIASVFINRLRTNMPLQSCATVEYIITEVLDRPHPKRLFNSDLTIVNPYNTYLYLGLPPSPICSPGLVALKAAFYPAETKYFYFRLVDENGRHAFSNNFDQHIEAGIIYTKQQAVGS